MLRASLILLITVPASVVCRELPSQSPTPTAEWYGAKIGEQVPPHSGSVEEALWPDLAKLPAPWTSVSVETDEQGHVAELDFWDAPDVLVDVPRNFHRDMPSKIPEYFKEGTFIGAELSTRFGEPTASATDPYEGRRWATLEWDFVPRFVRCDGTVPVFASAARDPSGRIAAVRLQYTPSGVELDILGMTSSKSTRSGPAPEVERAHGVERCKEMAAEGDSARDLDKDIDDFCRDNPDKCVTSIPGVTIIPVPGTTVVEVPCPRGSAHIACYKGKAISPPGPRRSSDQDGRADTGP